MSKNSVKLQEIKDFVHQHIIEEIDMGGLTKKGVSRKNFEHDLKLYELALIEGLINGIVWMGGEVENLEIKDL